MNASQPSLPVLDPQQVVRVNTRLLDWFAKNRRPLLWRAERNLYRTWVSEVMLQQTGVAEVSKKFPIFIATFPSVQSLAAANLDQVLQQWQGLGYYSRARNLWQSAQIIAAHGWPKNRQAWLKLAGVGWYTASAIAALCYQAPVLALDGNLRRVLSRVYGLTASRAVIDRYLIRSETTLVDPNLPADWNEALMDLGASLCHWRQPRCSLCPLQIDCRGQNQPIPTIKRRRPIIDRLVLVVRDQSGRVALEHRPASGIWPSLYCLPIVPALTAKPITSETIELARQAWFTGIAQAQIQTEPQPVIHDFTHFRLQLQVIRAILPDGSDLTAPAVWVEDVKAKPMPKIISDLISQHD